MVKKGDCDVIALGLTDVEKGARVISYVRANDIRKVVVLSPFRFRPSFELPCEVEHIEWTEIIKYKFFYRLLQEINNDTLLVVNECLRTQDRSDLTYNCIRHFLNQTKNQFVFQYLPIIDSIDDFMILFDFDSRSRWKREAFRNVFPRECKIEINRVNVSWREVRVETNAVTAATYAREKRRLVDNIGLRDPNVIPRNLYLISGKEKAKHINPGSKYVGRNNRFGLDNMCTYRDISGTGQYVVFELCHNFIDFIDFMSVSRQAEIPVMVSDLKVDRWYYERYQAWGKRLADAYSALQQ